MLRAEQSRRSQRLLVPLAVLGLTLCVGVWVAAWHQSRSEFVAQQQGIAKDLSNLAIVVELTAERVIDDADRSLKRIRDSYERAGYQFDWTGIAREGQRSGAHTTFIAVLNAQGRHVYSTTSADKAASTVDFSDRLYFRTHAQSNTDSLYISRTLRNRLDSTWRIFLTRPYRLSDGSFGGILMIGLDPSTLAQTYRGLALGGESGVAIVGDDGVVMAGTGIFADQIGSGFREGIRMGGVDRPDGTGLVHEEYAGQPRTLVYRKVGALPISVMVVVGDREHAQAWQLNRRRYFAAAAIITTSILLTVFLTGLSQLRYERRIRDLAYRDSLTSLPNRASFRMALDDAYQGLTHGRGFAVSFVDLDGFKAVNDKHGHLVGDALLVHVAERLRRNIRGSDFIARLGGDEFAILHDGATSASDLEIVAKRLCMHIAKPFELAGVDVRIGASIGIAQATTSPLGASEIVRKADVALYAAKSAGRGVCRTYTEALETRPSAASLPEAEAAAHLPGDPTPLPQGNDAATCAQAA